MDEHFLWQEEDLWKCRKHPSSRRRISGVCPSCLRERLLLLCPDCASLRPCPCRPASSSSSSSSFSSVSSAFDPPRSSVSGAIGAVGRVSSLIEIEPPFQRSRSLAFGGFRRTDGGNHRSGSRKWWPFSKKEEDAETEADFTNFSRSRSVGVAKFSSEGSGEEVRGKGWKWHFPSPMRAFRHRKSARVVHERSPLHRG